MLDSLAGVAKIIRPAAVCSTDVTMTPIVWFM
jgi:hypothetical protein